MRGLAIVLLVSVVMLDGSPIQKGSHGGPGCAPIYFLAVQALSCDRGTVKAYGASNLPQGAIITMVVTDFAGDGWHDISNEAFAETDNKGLFRTEIHPKLNTEFHHNSLLRAYFTPYRPKQSDEVLR